jgi:hypothetical protein
MKTQPDSPTTDRRPSVEVYFQCCNTSAIIYFNAQGTAYAGHCPKCASPVRIPVSAGGSKSRHWVAG